MELVPYNFGLNLLSIICYLHDVEHVVEVEEEKEEEEDIS
jgi:hypothetical protein